MGQGLGHRCIWGHHFTQYDTNKRAAYYVTLHNNKQDLLSANYLSGSVLSKYFTVIIQFNLCNNPNYILSIIFAIVEILNLRFCGIICPKSQEQSLKTITTLYDLYSLLYSQHQNCFKSLVLHHQQLYQFYSDGCIMFH